VVTGALPPATAVVTKYSQPGHNASPLREPRDRRAPRPKRAPRYCDPL